MRTLLKSLEGFTITHFVNGSRPGEAEIWGRKSSLEASERIMIIKLSSVFDADGNWFEDVEG